MTNETPQPLGEQPTRSVKDTELVGQVLGEEAAADMEELTGKQNAADQATDTNTLEVNFDDQLTVDKSENTVTPEQRKKEYIEWTKETVKNATWVKEVFTFNPDGTVDVNGHLDIWWVDVYRLPPGLNQINGDLKIAYSKITDLSGLPKIINGSLDIRGLSTSTIPLGLKISGKVYISHDNKMLIKDAKSKSYNVDEVEDL